MWAIVFFSFLISIVFYPYLPEKLQSLHSGESEKIYEISKLFAILLIPIFNFLIALFFTYIYRLEKKQIEFNFKINKSLGLPLVLFLSLFHITYLINNSIFKINPVMYTQLSSIFIALFLFWGGQYLKNSKSNLNKLFSSWSYKSDFVKEKTSTMAGNLLTYCSIFIGFFGVIFPGSIFFIIPLFLLVYWLCIISYSYSIYRNSIKKSNLQ